MLPALAAFALNVGKSLITSIGSSDAARREARQSMVTAGFEATGALNSSALSTQLEIEDAFYSADRSIRSAGFAGERAIRNNQNAAEQARINIEQLLRATSIEENRLRDQGDRVMASQAAYFGANGVDLSEGAPVMLAAMSAGQLETDVRMLRANGFASAAGLAAQRVAYAERALDARDETLLRIEDATTAADRIGGRAVSLQTMRNEDTLGKLSMTLTRARQRSQAASASALMRFGTDTVSAGINAFGFPGGASTVPAATPASFPAGLPRFGFASPSQRA
ncbi:MAG: hypothetical protein J0L51_00070 [Rhizobiales bacterium]|nr:hypothetical protein [Hyphomicrobiales bacterium]